MKIGVELEFFICHKSDETFYMPDIISRYLKYNSGFISMQKDSNGICIKAKNELGVTISFEFTYSIIEFSIDPQYDILSLHSIINTAIYDFSLFIDHYELMLISHGIAPFNIQFKYVNNPYYKLIREFHGNDNIAKICSSQSHIDYKDEDLIKIINTYNKCNWINALLFSNSPHIVNSNKTILCYRDYIWKFSSHGRDSNNILISKEFNDIEDLNAFNNSKLIFMVYRESKPILLSQIPFNQYVTLKQVKGLQFDEDCISETWIHPSVDDYKYLRSYQNVAITNRRTIEIRSDCQQPFNRLIYRKRLLNYILCIRFFIEVHSIVSASRFFHMPTYLRVVIECQFRFFPFFPAFSRNCPDYFLHTSGSSSFRSLSDLGAR